VLADKYKCAEIDTRLKKRKDFWQVAARQEKTPPQERN